MNEKIMVLDTETTNDIDCPLVYDVGFIVMDMHGNVYGEYSYVVADIFLDNDLMKSAYFADKIPSYWKDIKNGKRELKKLLRMYAKNIQSKRLWPITAALIIFLCRLLKDF